MRLLLRKGEGSYELTKDFAEDALPKYAILSHTWLNDEEDVTFEDMSQGDIQTKPGFAKIRFCGEQAAKHGLKYFWVDSCCINKDSSSELQESLNRMFTWYRNAERCYAYLADVSLPDQLSAETRNRVGGASWEQAFRQSRWFTRGWTLQELLAPQSVEFFSVEGVRFGDTRSLEQCIHEITGIPHRALRGDPLDTFSIEERLSWQQARQTTRGEDKAYSLFGIFNVRLPLMYGESTDAFTRLKREIYKARKYSEAGGLGHILSSLPVASEASFNSLKNQYEPTCLPTTRTELLQEIRQWADTHDERCIYWLNGIAGTGKSTIARTIARAYHERGTLGASFFFTRGGGDLGNANKLVTTLARQLATRIPASGRHILEAVMEQPDIAEHSLRDQWEHLIIRPLSNLSLNSAPSIIVVVIDALDECDSERDIRVILRVIATAQQLTTVKLRILITSRPEIELRLGFKRIPEAERKVFILHEISKTLVDRDLNCYFEDRLSTIREERGFDDDWPGMRTIERLVENSCGLFIWASTACRFIHEGRTRTMRRMSILLNKTDSEAGPEKQLDQIYMTVLRDAVLRDYTENEKAEVFEGLRQVLGTIAILFSPLSIQSIAKLVQLPYGHTFKDDLADLHTIFNIPSQDTQPIRLHHPSFRDFLLDPRRCTDPNLWVDEKRAHAVLADSCIDMMKKMLKQDICGLGCPGTLLSDVDPGRIRECIPPELQYACMYWVKHVQLSGERLADGSRVDLFLREHFLNWVEAMSLMGKSGEMWATLRLYDSLLMPDVNSRQQPFIRDSRRVGVSFQGITTRAPLQIYSSALVFLPPSNRLRGNFWDQLYPWLHKIQVVDADAPAPRDAMNYSNDVTFTPDSSGLAAGSALPHARFWKVGTKTAVPNFGGPVDNVSSVAISPDGKTIAAGSDDFTVRAWDIETHASLYVLRAHESWVNSVVFSPDGKLLLSGSMDCILALWDAASGKSVKKMSNQGSPVNASAFSPDGYSFAVASFDWMVRVWDISAESEELLLLLDGHSGCVNSVGFSRSGKHIVSGSDDTTIKIWAADKGTEVMTLKGHTKRVMAVKFSPDARCIVSGSEDKTIRLWETASGAVLRTLKGHTSGINSVVFSPNGRLLASEGFNDEVFLWDANSGALIGELGDFKAQEDELLLLDMSQESETPILADEKQAASDFSSTFEPTPKGHASAVTCLVYSPGGKILASASQDGTVKLWQSLGREHWKLKGHSDSVNHIEFSPDGLLLASASSDTTIRIWSTATHESLCLLEGHTGHVLLVRFSSDSRLLASCATDKTIRMWDLDKGELMMEVGAHEAAVNDIVFSSDNSSLASCSEDGQVIVWDLTATAPPTRLSGHSGAVNSVAFSPSGERLISCSEDTTARLWDIAKGSCNILKGGGSSVTCAAFSHDGQFLAYCTVDGLVRILDAATMVEDGLVDTKIVIRTISFSSCGRHLETDRGVLEISSNTLPSLSFLSLNHRHSLFAGHKWVQRDTDDALWLPEEYQARCVATIGETIVLGHASGALTFVGF